MTHEMVTMTQKEWDSKHASLQRALSRATNAALNPALTLADKLQAKAKEKEARTELSAHRLHYYELVPTA